MRTISHFTVIVFGDDHEGQLAPYHEFECTGVNDEYVQTIDTTEKVREEFESGKVDRLKDEDGTLHKPWEDRFYRDPTEEESKKVGLGSGWTGGPDGISFTSRDWGDGKGYRAKVSYVPDGFEKVEVPRCEVESFAEFLSDHHGLKEVPSGEEPDLEGDHKYGYYIEDKDGNVVSVFDRTNLNAKWDWYQVGGRWRGYFRLKQGAARHPELIGSPGVFGNEAEFDADYARLGDIDIEGMREIRGREAASKWDLVHKVFGDTPEAPAWSDFVKQMEEEGKTIEDARAAYRLLPRLAAVHEHDRLCHEKKDYEDEILGWSGDVTSYQVPRDEYVQKARDRALKPYAYIHEGKWIAPGEYGWWGYSSDEEEDRIAYTKAFNDLLDTLPDDTMLTLVDCHI